MIRNAVREKSAIIFNGYWTSIYVMPEKLLLCVCVCVTIAWSAATTLRNPLVSNRYLYTITFFSLFIVVPFMYHALSFSLFHISRTIDLSYSRLLFVSTWIFHWQKGGGVGSVFIPSLWDIVYNRHYLLCTLYDPKQMIFRPTKWFGNAR